MTSANILSSPDERSALSKPFLTHRKHGGHRFIPGLMTPGRPEGDRTGVLFNLRSPGCCHSCHLFKPNVKLSKVSWLFRKGLGVQAWWGLRSGAHCELTRAQIAGFQRGALSAERHTGELGRSALWGLRISKCCISHSIRVFSRSHNYKFYKLRS